jgi:hypothetical protein
VRDYFAGEMRLRQTLLWVVATRQALDRWEADIAALVRLGLQREQPSGSLVWQSEIDRHMVFVGARNLLRALDLDDLGLTIDRGLRSHLKDARDLLEHWDGNMPIFNERPRSQEPRHRSGQSYVKNHPDSSPYTQFAWNNTLGAMLDPPELAASQVHDLLDDAQARVLELDPSFAEYVPLRPPSPWVGCDEFQSEWWPAPTDRSVC